jgi:hypothetical protein
LWYAEPANSKAIGYAKFFSRSHNAVIRVYDGAANMIEKHEHKGDFKVVSFNESSVLLLLVVHCPVCGALAFRARFARADDARFAIGRYYNPTGDRHLSIFLDRHFQHAVTNLLV